MKLPEGREAGCVEIPPPLSVAEIGPPLTLQLSVADCPAVMLGALDVKLILESAAFAVQLPSENVHSANIDITTTKKVGFIEKIFGFPDILKFYSDSEKFSM